MRSYVVDPDRSTVLVSARSTMGPIEFEGRGLEGAISAHIGEDGAVRDEPAPAAWMTLDMRELRSGNELYDAELRRRLDVRRYPICRVELRDVSHVGQGRYAVAGDVTVQATARRLSGTVEVTVRGPDRLSVTGQQVIDIRDFKITAPQLMLMRIYPEVRVQLFLDARGRSDDDTQEAP